MSLCCSWIKKKKLQKGSERGSKQRQETELGASFSHAIPSKPAAAVVSVAIIRKKKIIGFTSPNYSSTRREFTC